MPKVLSVIIFSLFTGNFFYLNAQEDTISVIQEHFQEGDCLEEQAGADSLVFPIIKSFLGNWQRNYYGENPPDKLDVVWKHYLGKGETVISRNIGTKEWAGAGWTGQPLLVQENNKLFLIQGAYDHHLKKIDAQTGELVWQYAFDDVIKGTGTIWVNKSPDKPENALVILQGSRLGTGNYLDAKHVPSYRAISYFTGKELWRMDQKWTHSYSRDVDGSALILNDTVYIGLENSLFTVFNPDHRKARMKDGMLQPEIFQEIKLYTPEDVSKHKYNVVTESSPALLNDRIYVASGSGHVFGYNLSTRSIDWDFYIGSDMDGSTIVTSDQKILVSVEKQYIKGPGGIFKLNPSRDPEEAVVWYFPTGNNDFAGWEGGVIGSVGINDHYIQPDQNHLAAFVGIDEQLYVVNHQQTDSAGKVLGPDSLTLHNKPRLVFQYHTGPSISTPVFVDDKLIVATYWGIYLFEYDEHNNFVLLDRKPGSFESTPIVYNQKIYIASRDGYLYCLGIEN
ncbi:MAG: PQQ-binding-like beta-propeller repeat protein [Bacteroidales bacterium]|jgi:outer membrane protein assembly factor BamB|nr:PQQ-binding-like beta-propeller repeat protein [Bacteroidales bacterium]